MCSCVLTYMEIRTYHALPRNLEYQFKWGYRNSRIRNFSGTVPYLLWRKDSFNPYKWLVANKGCCFAISTCVCAGTYNADDFICSSYRIQICKGFVSHIMITLLSMDMPYFPGELKHIIRVGCLHANQERFCEQK